MACFHAAPALACAVLWWGVLVPRMLEVEREVARHDVLDAILPQA